MKYLRSCASAAVFAASICFGTVATAGGSFGGYGSYGGSSGGSYGASYGGSSGGYSVYRPGLLSRIHARHSASRGGSSGGSSGGVYSVSRYTVASYGSTGGSSGGSSGGRHFTPVRSALSAIHSWKANIHARHAARRVARYSASSGGSSGGSTGYRTTTYVSSYRSTGGSSGGSSYRSNYVAPTYSAPVYSAPVYSAPISSGSTGGSSSSYQFSTPSYSSGTVHGATSNHGETIIDERVISPAPQGDVMPQVEGGVGEVEIPAVPELGFDAGLSNDIALLTVAVPVESATVKVNGNLTKTGGVVRQFMSRGLVAGSTYTYVVDVTYEQDGKQHTETRSIKLVGGAKERLVFDAPAESKLPVETIVKVNVPKDAVVVLAGNETAGKGTERVFRTNQLTNGEQWTNYTIVVKAKVGGQVVSKEQTINVFAGSTNELDFDFSDLVAVK